MRVARELSRRGTFRVLVLVTLAGWLAGTAFSAQRKKKEDVTQTLQLPKELPSAVSGDPRHLSFYVTPLSAKGLLSAQIRDGLKALSRQAGSDTVLKIRAFVAGSGDVRRVRDLVSEVFTERKQPLPALSLIRSGGLPLEGAQVVLEATAATKKEVNPRGLAFISAQVATSENPLDPVAPLTVKSLARLQAALQSAGTDAGSVVRVTCFLSSLENLADSRQKVADSYPRAALNFVQTQRAPGQALAACEAVARLQSDPGRLQFVGTEIAEVNAAEVILTGSQVSFGYQEADARLAFERLGRELTQAGTSYHQVAFAHFYPLSNGIAAQVRKVQAEFFDASRPPASSVLLFEGLPSMDAGFAVDVIAVK